MCGLACTLASGLDELEDTALSQQGQPGFWVLQQPRLLGPGGKATVVFPMPFPYQQLTGVESLHVTGGGDVSQLSPLPELIAAILMMYLEHPLQMVLEDFHVDAPPPSGAGDGASLVVGVVRCYRSFFCPPPPANMKLLVELIWGFGVGCHQDGDDSQLCPFHQILRGLLKSWSTACRQLGTGRVFIS